MPTCSFGLFWIVVFSTCIRVHAAVCKAYDKVTDKPPIMRVLNNKADIRRVFDVLPSHTPLCDNVANRFMAWIKRLCWCKHTHGKQYQSC